MKNPAATFHWLVSVFEKQDVSFVVTGGLAAKSYGSPRPLNDIDVDIRTADFSKIQNDVKPNVTFGPAHYRGPKWDLPLITLLHNGQEIDISGGDNIKIYNGKTSAWVRAHTDFLAVKHREIFDLRVPVIAPERLIAYKSLLDGEHQQVDIDAVSRFLKS